MRKLLILAAALGSLAVPAQLRAQPLDDAGREASKADARCALVMTVIMRDEAYRQSGAIGLYYFAGRIEARDPNVDLAEVMKKERSAMQNSQFKSETERCGAALQTKTKNLEALKTAFGGRGVGR